MAGGLRASGAAAGAQRVGQSTHNLRAIFVEARNHDAAVPEWVSTFTDWVKDRFDAGDIDAVLDGGGGRGAG